MRVQILEEKLKTLVAQQVMCEEAEVTPSAHLIDDLGYDSLDCVELAMSIEEAFNIEIPDEEADKLRIVGDVFDYVKKRVK